MLQDIGEKNFRRTHMYDSLKDDSKKALYPNSMSLTRLSTLLRLFNIKARNGWIDKNFTEFLELLPQMLPKVIHCQPVIIR